MTTETVLQNGAALLTPWAKGQRTPEANRLDVLIHAPDLLACVKALLDARWGYLVAITGLDYVGKSAAAFAQDARWLSLVEAGAPAAPEGVLEVLYHFSDGPAMLTLRMLLLRDRAAIASVCGLIPSASFFERELSEMFGIQVVNTPDPKRLFLSDDWPAEVYPLRKDFVPKPTE
jgi:NADH:ubiquinone oxidoreductase subunit C